MVNKALANFKEIREEQTTARPNAKDHDQIKPKVAATANIVKRSI
jgi:hypothetical protein